MVKRSVHCSTFDPITVLENYINTYCQMRRMHFGEDIHVVKKNFSFFFSIFLSFFFAFSFINFFIGGHLIFYIQSFSDSGKFFVSSLSGASLTVLNSEVISVKNIRFRRCH